MKPSVSDFRLFHQLLSTFSPIPKTRKKGWEVSNIEGNATIIDSDGIQHSGRILDISLDFLVLISRFGQLVYGLLDHSWDQWAFFEGSSESEPSGVWIAIISIFDDIPHIGLIKEKRPLIKGGVLAVPHGFVDPGEAGHKAAIREMLEETGINTTSITSLGFFGFNTAFFGGSVNGSHSDEGFVVLIQENPEHIKFGPKETDLVWVPVNDFIVSGYCSPSVTVASKAITTIQKEKK